MAEYLCHAAVERVLLRGGQLQTESVGLGLYGIQYCFPLSAPLVELLCIVRSGRVELADPFLYGRHIVEQLAGEEPVLGRGDERAELGGGAAEQEVRRL